MVKTEFISILSHFLHHPEHCEIQRIGSGHINYTYKVTHGENQFILQRVNKNVFRQPDQIARNLRVASDHIKRNHAHYLFTSPLLTRHGREMFYDDEGFPWRLFPYIENTITLDQVDTAEQAYSAAAEFGRLNRYLSDCSPSGFEATIPNFHNLSLRFQQFESALASAQQERKAKASECINACSKFRFLLNSYEDLLNRGTLKLRVMHNDTKINNVLFDQVSYKAVCVIDLDTLMPGYFIYDLGDMVRTFVSPVSEEEKDFSKIQFRKNIYEALLDGYLSRMNEVLTLGEKEVIPFAGKMMTYIMALRFLADYLNGDIYYQTSYPGQNLVRAANQIHVLRMLEEHLNN